jgi:hypothetical protein
MAHLARAIVKILVKFNSYTSMAADINFYGLVCGQVVRKNLQHLFKGQHLFSLLCYASYSTHIIRYGQAKDKDTDKKKKRRKVRRRNAVPPSANGVSIPVMKVLRVG